MAVIAQRERTADGDVVISRDEYREYVELQQKRDRSELSMRARMVENNQKALNLSRKVVQLLDANKGIKSALSCEVYDLANEILAEE